MTSFEENRLGNLDPAVTIRRGLPTQRATPQGAVRVMSVAALRNGTPARHFADYDDIADVGIEPAQAGDVLIAVEGGTVGEILVVEDDVEEFVPSQQVATLRVLDTALVDPWYLGAWLTTEPAREQIRRLARGSTIQRVPVNDLASIPVILPPIAEQREIGRRFLAFDKAIRAHRAVAACLEDLRDVELTVTFADAGAGQTGDLRSRI